MTREEIIEQNEIVAFIQDRHQVELKQAGSQLATNTCPVTSHRDGHNCVSVDPEKQVWHCNDCDKGGTVIEWVMHDGQVTKEEAIAILGGGVVGDTQRTTEVDAQPEREAVRNSPAQESKIIDTYNYTDENGQLLYQVCRMEPKSFTQRQPVNGKWKYDLVGITRVLYNLPQVLQAKTVCVTEGEKDANNLNALGFVATTNSGGSKNWLEAYADQLKNKDVIVFEDADSAGKIWSDKVIESCRDKAASVKRIKFKGCKDVSDWLLTLGTTVPSDLQAKLQEVIDGQPHVVAPIPIYTIWEMEEQFATNVNETNERSFSMGNFSTKFKSINNQLMPGEVVMIVGDTSQGKTAIMQAIMISAKPKPTLMFELELPLDAMFTRSVQMQRGCYESDIIKGYKENPKGRYADNFDKLQHIMICPQSGLTMDDVERYIIKSELKFGGRPNLVFVDYMGLVRKDRTFSRYEAMAYSAEQCKVIAKRTNTIVFIGSQVARPASSKEHVKDVQIHHAKGAGELENSSNLVLGISRPEERILRMKVLKNTRGPIGAELEFDFDPGKMQITEKVDTGPAVVKASHWESAKE